MNKKVYVTNSIPYVNATPHIGHALEFVQSDAIVRYFRLLGDEVKYLCGSDDNALKNVQAAEKAGLPPHEFVKRNAEVFQHLAEELNVNFDIFQNGSNEETHYKSSQKLWTLCQEAGDIYKKEYEGLYCVGCETFYTEDELDENGECFEHPGRKLDRVTEENYFFKLSKYQEQLKELISTNKLKLVPEIRKNEILSFLKNPLQDISISRSNARARNWGVPVPGDDSQRMYVWFDALNIYQSGIGFGWNEKEYEQWWPAKVHVIGKGINRFHAVYWPAFLMSAGLKLPESLFVHGYITVNGQKMSKTLGNVVDPFELIKKYGLDPLRYYFLREIPPYDDGDFSESRMEEIYNADLANELGNLLSRITTITEQDEISVNNEKPSNVYTKEETELFESFQYNRVLEKVWERLKELNKKTNDVAPWKLSADERKEFLSETLAKLHEVGYKLLPFLPDTSDKIIKATTGKIEKGPALFPRL